MDNRIFLYKGQVYPSYLKSGPGSAYISSFALFYCRGTGVNIGYGSEDGKIFKDNCDFLDLKDGVDCTNINQFQEESLDFVFSSHTLEHIKDWKASLSNWCSKIKCGGCLFLYLPHYDMEYWRPENNKKHQNILFPNDVVSVIERHGFDTIFTSGRDLYWSYAVVALKNKI